MHISNTIDPGLLDSTALARSRETAGAEGGARLPSGETMPPVSGSTEIDIDAFMEAWGSNDATWDIDANGVVDGEDLGMLLATMQGADQGNADLKSLLDAWGSADESWDLNGDGVVNGADLGLYLEYGAGGTPQNDAVQSITGFMEAWGTSDPAYDINGDGVVDGGDLGAFLSQLEINTDQATLEAFQVTARPWILTFASASSSNTPPRSS